MLIKMREKYELYGAPVERGGCNVSQYKNTLLNIIRPTVFIFMCLQWTHSGEILLAQF